MLCVTEKHSNKWKIDFPYFVQKPFSFPTISTSNFISLLLQYYTLLSILNSLSFHQDIIRFAKLSLSLIKFSLEMFSTVQPNSQKYFPENKSSSGEKYSGNIFRHTKHTRELPKEYRVLTTKAIWMTA